LRPVFEVALFALGVYLSVRVIAALLGIIDLWYTIRTAYPMVIARILGWGGATVATARVLGDGRRRAFLWGLAAFLVLYLSMYALRHLFLRRPAA
jgi:hypothetical protein